MTYLSYNSGESGVAGRQHWAGVAAGETDGAGAEFGARPWLPDLPQPAVEGPGPLPGEVRAQVARRRAALPQLSRVSDFNFLIFFNRYIIVFNTQSTAMVISGRSSFLSFFFFFFSTHTKSYKSYVMIAVHAAVWLSGKIWKNVYFFRCCLWELFQTLHDDNIHWTLWHFRARFGHLDPNFKVTGASERLGEERPIWMMYVHCTNVAHTYNVFKKKGLFLCLFWFYMWFVHFFLV